jgi:hypothetical protein
MNMEDESARRLTQIRDEVQILESLWPIALEVQWDRAPVDVVGTPLKRRAERPDPTADIVCDESRLSLRRQLIRSNEELAEAMVRVRGVRRGLELALSRYGIPPSGRDAE